MTRKPSLLTVLLMSGVQFAAMGLLSTAARAQGDDEKVYKAKCASCHGADGAGATPAGKATKTRSFCSDEVKKETDEEWTTVIVKGRNKMPAYDKKLADGVVKNLITYIRGLCKM